ncbi:hypothetical protein JIP32914_10196 [Tenacibaculum maritimum]|uniref:hypothetical protein n=1 Tax=Tenacibaculum maritimum TaxID=107401 RepID=UPI0012E6B08E|nr:hypothetical protein [Tenacibaculum maritimum]CAA0152694.1 hypothetical protein JIP32914_10196 [Tenacibaculum maritimum]
MIKEIRKYYDVSNRIIAVYIQRSLSFLESAINGRRGFDLPSINKLLALYKSLQLATPINMLSEITPVMNEEKKETLQQLKKQKEAVAILLIAHQKKLAQLQQQREQWFRGINACISLLNNTELSTTDVKWIDLRKNHIKARLAKHSLFKETEQQLKIKLLKDEERYLTAAIISLKATI